MTQFFHGLLCAGLMLPRSHCPQVAGRWYKKCTLRSFHLQNKEVVQRKKNSSWGRFQQLRYARLNGVGGCLQNRAGRASHVARKEREANDFPVTAIYKYFGIHHLCVMWPHDSVEAKRVPYFPSRSPRSLPQSQPITSNLSAAKRRGLRTRPEGSTLGCCLARITGSNQNSIKCYHEKG